MGDTVSDSHSLSWNEMFRTASSVGSGVELPITKRVSMDQRKLDAQGSMKKANWSSENVLKPEEDIASERKMDVKFRNYHFELAIYVAMAHAGLLLLMGTLFGLGLLLKDFWKPIQWAVLCSITMRETQTALVRFWNPPLRQGLVQTLFAIPLAILRALLATADDAQAFVLWASGKGTDGPLQVGFSKLFQWLVTFSVFLFGCENFGFKVVAIVAFISLILYAAGISFSRWITCKSWCQGMYTRWVRWITWPVVQLFSVLNKQATQFLAARLDTIIAIGLISLLILGSVVGLTFFSYKVGMESKDAVVALKVHVENSNYSEMIGLSQWLETNNVPELVDQYAGKVYEGLFQQIDKFAAQYNLTDFSHAGKDYFISLMGGKKEELNITLSSSPSLVASRHPVIMKVDNARIHLKSYDFMGIYSELSGALLLLLDHLHVKPEELLEKMKSMSQTGADIGKQIFSSGSVLFHGGTSILFSATSSIASGAMELLSFFAQAAVFLSLLYYLMTSEVGGVTEQMLGLVPLSSSTRARCAVVLNHAVSSVLLATVKSAFFQASFTWLFFRYFHIHFLYTSTLLALVIALLPIFPYWLPALPAAAQLALEGHYIKACLLLIAHVLIIQFGNDAIHQEIPGHNGYLMGLSIAGGMTLFSPALEGAIMGPLLMTVLVALKNLYHEFVLNPYASEI